MFDPHLWVLSPSDKVFHADRMYDALRAVLDLSAEMRRGAPAVVLDAWADRFERVIAEHLGVTDEGS